MISRWNRKCKFESIESKSLIKHVSYNCWSRLVKTGKIGKNCNLENNVMMIRVDENVKTIEILCKLKILYMES